MLCLGRKAVSVLRIASKQPVLRVFASSGPVSKAEISARSGFSNSPFANRTVIIYKLTRDVTTQAQGKVPSPWRLAFDMLPNSKWANPLMGWTSGSDTHGVQLANTLTFDTMEEAVEYCKGYGIEYTVEAAQVSDVNQTVAKNYADNFVWDGDEERDNTGMDFWASRRSGGKVVFNCDFS